MTLSHVIWLRRRIHVEKFFILIVYQFEMALCTVINLYRNHEWANNQEIKCENVQPPGLLAQVVPSHPNDFHLWGSSPSINTYPAKKKKKKKKE